ncbi:MAG: hypothetical protein JW839_12780 [Candidatus Lokiarchaeota archaeon]|nr:hypothetical protein [Candidatus Lokiarchaeota archaeon]
MSGTYRVGFSSTNITPPLDLGIRVGGYLRLHKVSERVLDFLFARAMCFRHPDDPAQGLIVMSVDLVGFQYRIARLVRRAISRRTGVPVSRIILHFTHSHSSPDTIGIFPNRLANLLTFDVQYDVIRYIMRHMIRAGVNAFEDATAAMVGYGTTASPEPFLAVQRRPPYSHITDPVRFLKVTDPDGNLTGIVVNYQAHPTQLPGNNANVHPEYPGMVAKALHARYPNLQFAAYFNGAAGDVTIHGYKGYYAARYHHHATHEDAMAYALKVVDDLGKRFADLVAEAIDDVAVEPVASVDVQRRFVFPRIGRVKSVWGRLKHYPRLKDKARILLREFRDMLRVGLFHDFYRFLNGRYLPMLNIVTNGRRTYHQTELFVARINDVYWFSSPGEPFITYQENLFKHVPSQKHFFSQMNETCGYIYPWNFYVQGGYEKFFSFDALFGRYMYELFKETLNRMS